MTIIKIHLKKIKIRIKILMKFYITITRKTHNNSNYHFIHLKKGIIIQLLYI
jgi:hypothetical protein